MPRKLSRFQVLDQTETLLYTRILWASNSFIIPWLKRLVFGLVSSTNQKGCDFFRHYFLFELQLGCYGVAENRLFQIVEYIIAARNVRSFLSLSC